MAINHYENFPVASWLLPKPLRGAVRTIYTFARCADDWADEGNLSDDARIQALNTYIAQLDSIQKHLPLQDPLFIALQDVIHTHHLPMAPFYQLLSAFKQDVIKKRYATYDELIDYCSRSAHPIGHLMLHLYDAASPENIQAANAICSALQLTNFWQDIAIDWNKNRIYLPLADLAQFHLTEDHIAQQIISPEWHHCMRYQVSRTRQLMESGAHLVHKLPGRIGWELRAVIQGGLRILNKIEDANYDIYQHRPVLNRYDWISMTWKILRMS